MGGREAAGRQARMQAGRWQVGRHASRHAGKRAGRHVGGGRHASTYRQGAGRQTLTAYESGQIERGGVDACVGVNVIHVSQTD